MTDVKVDKDWKKEAKDAKEDLTSKAKKNEVGENPHAYVSCEEVALYLTELSKVLEQFSAGIRGSMEEMMKRSVEGAKGDKNDDK